MQFLAHIAMAKSWRSVRVLEKNEMKKNSYLPSTKRSICTEYNMKIS